MRLKHRVAVITGGARGIGRACAERFLAEGAKVVIGDVDAAALAETQAALGNADLRTSVADVSRRADVERLLAEAVAAFGRLDILVNNAGIARNQDFLSITEDDFDSVIGINLRGAFFGTQAAARQMIAQNAGAAPDARRGGVIINMSSVNALLAIPGLAAYACSKGALNQLTKVAAIEFAPHNIRVVAIGPGTILTELARAAVMTDDQARRKVLARTPIGRAGAPEEVASVASFLASEDASYITGQTIYPDGGRLALNYTVPVAD